MPKKIDLTGQTINGFRIIKKSQKSNNKRTYWEFICPICNGTGTASTTNIKTGVIKSCGCLKREFIKKYNTTHGESRTKLYICWHNMISRTQNCQQSTEAVREYIGEKIRTPRQCQKD